MSSANWIQRRSFHHQDFARLDRLIELKHAHSQRISVVIPTLNEERSISEVVGVIRQTLMQRHPLVDEVLVIDSDSSDQTRERAADAGAQVLLAHEILPELPLAKGKGENLWKSLSVCQGDLICFVDADITNIHPRFVYGLLGPLLEQPEIEYVKGFYERPMASGSSILPHQGGRVTEILVRPLLSLFYPQLTQFCQPLAGEYAARRELLEQLAFPTGYGVEVAHLIDAFQLRGLDAFAQVDLEERVHRNRPLGDLGAMAFEILHSLLPRLQRDGHLAQLSELPLELAYLAPDHEGVHAQSRLVPCHERPPLNTLNTAKA